MTWIFRGYSIRVPVETGQAQILLSRLGGSRLDVIVHKVVLYCPDGTDPGIAANTDTVYVGPNKTHDFPLQPGAWTEFTDVNPFDIAYRSGSAGQQLFIQMGAGEEATAPRR